MSETSAAAARAEALYRMFNAAGELLYVGITCQFAERVRAHAEEKQWWRQVARIDIEHFSERTAVEAAERVAIRVERPLFNWVHNRPERICSAARPEPKPPTRKTRQRPIGVPNDMWRDALAIARKLDERDEIGGGLAAVIRRDLTAYVARHRAMLETTTEDE